MSSGYCRQWTPDVFVSFKDEMESFKSALCARLTQAGIGCRQSSKEVNKAIREAKFALIVFSANYVKCNSCLDELVKILFRRANSKFSSLVVIPIFHGMDPTKVTKDLDSFHRKEKDEKKKLWRRALAEVEGISCYDLKKANDSDELVLIDKIVKRLVNEIWSLYSHKVFGPFGGRGETSWHFDEKNRNGVVCAKFVNTLPFPIKKFKFDKDEGIISFSGYFQQPRNDLIQTLTFLTTHDKRLHVGPNVEERQADFSVPLPPYGGKVIEFFGSKNGDEVLTSIGARVELIRVEIPPEVSCPVELFGSRRGVKWDAGQLTVKGIRAVFNSSGKCIRSIAFLTDDGEWWPHDRNRQRQMEFIIPNPDEYLSSISGYHTYDGITSLTFLTSKKSTVTFGGEKGTYFSSPKTGYKIVGFYGWSDENLLYGIGAYFKPIPDLCPVTSIGPFGGIAWDDGKFKGVKKIHIFNYDGIRYIKIVYYDNKGNDRPIIHGDYTREFSNNNDTVDLKYPEEYLTSISGYTRDDGSIESLIFHSNRQKKHFGRLEGKYFWYPSNKSRIIGFYGTFGKTLNSIGVYEEPISGWKSVKHVPFSREFPGSDRINWDDGEHSNVVGYRVTVNKESPKIESITFMYESNGSLIEGSRRGGGDSSSGRWVMLDYPRESIDRIRGYWRVEANETIIHDLKIVTTYANRPCTNWTYAKRGEPDSDSESKRKPNSNPNLRSKRKSEPEPEREWPKRFTILEKSDVGRRIVGFFGKAKTCLNFIGAHLEP